MSRIYLSPPHMGADERALLIDAFDSNWIAPLGPHVDAFEDELARAVGVGHAAALASGTAALHLALQILGVGANDHVITATHTFAATANAIRYLGAVPVFVDSHPGTWTLDPDLLEEELQDRAARGSLPAALVTVDLYGQCCDYNRILATCRRYDVPVVEDAAEALGATYDSRYAGTFGDMAVLSFNGNKIITTSGGGALLSDNRGWMERARFLASQAREPAPHYEHTELGFNYRLSNLLAAVGRGQLRHLDDRVDALRAINQSYRAALGKLPGLSFMPEAPDCRSTFWLTCICIDPATFGADREAVRQHLAAHDIEARPVWKPMHMQPVFQGFPHRGGHVAERLFAQGLCLPSGSALSSEELTHVADLGRVPASRVTSLGGRADPHR